MDAVPSTGARRLSRQSSSSRLPTHAPLPMSLKVKVLAPCADAASAVIPLLLPLYGVSTPAWIWDAAALQDEYRQLTAGEATEAKREGPWKHPATPFYCEAGAANVGPAAISLPHCA